MKHSLLETAIGAVVLIGALIFLMFSYATAHQGAGSMVSGTYRLTAMFDNIGGLKSGDSVMISGVKVGTIDDITLDQKLYRAEVHFNVTNDIKIAKDSSAKISSESLLGGKYLELQPGGDESDLKDGDVIEMTQAPANLEDLLGRFIFSAADSKKEEGKDSGAASATPTETPAYNDSAEPDHP
jgi:phospholipid/cholesterol/gamma-HCH transport system substrate-binding protein